MILKATVEYPLTCGGELLPRYEELAKAWRTRIEEKLTRFFPQKSSGDVRDMTYLWARTVRCPHCEGLVPLSPNWELGPGGKGVRLRPSSRAKRCEFEIVNAERDQSPGTVKQGHAKCPFPGCERVIDGDEVKRQARSGEMGEQLFAVVYKQRVDVTTKTGKKRETWERGFRPARPGDDVSAAAAGEFSSCEPGWAARGLIPTEEIPPGLKTSEPTRYGVKMWRDMFNYRQLFGHVAAVEVYCDLLAEWDKQGKLDQVGRAAFGCLALSLDKLRDYNSRFTRWHSKREVIVNTFDTHNFAFRWTYAEMGLLVPDVGYDWALEQTRKCMGELVDFVRGHGDAAGQAGMFSAPRATVAISNDSADALTGIETATVDAVVMDPPYYDNVMYAELSDFFYVWLKRTAGLVYPELFRRKLTDKDREAVANPARFEGQPGPRELASRDYQEKMASIFAECRRVLKPDGILTLMFTHKATGAWDALASGLIQAGFTITASWPVNTEAEGSLHIKDKSAANSTILLACRPRRERAADDVAYWEDVEPLVAGAVRGRVQEYQRAGISGVDLYLACFGPALEEFAKHWPLKRGNPRPSPSGNGARQRRVAAVADVDPYAVTPEDALEAARREVKKWRLDRLLRSTRHPELDPTTEWFVLAWDAFKAPEFPYDEALRLARVVGVDLDRDLVGHVCEKDASDIVLWDSSTRAAKHALGPADGTHSLLDALHHAAHRARTESVGAARDLIEKSGAEKQPGFHAALAAVLEVLPVSSTFTKVEEEKGAVAEASNDFDALEKLRRLAYAERVPEPEQLLIWADAVPEAKA
jgi:adenine-specific DNA methylase